ncbi:hypothetical protein PENSPDRAFT_337131 [Peniophora sp. CONT]|nr:hypothetical protein PENSPDRAFT_337131 [Peniophora sp. CONT]
MAIGSFPSQLMTDLAIQRAGASLLSLDGHFEDHEGPGYVLTDYQFSLIEKYASRLRSLGHDDYWAWSELFYCMGTFPELETARIWDESGPDEWDECIDTPRLQSLYMNNVLIPFYAPALRYLRMDMDNVHWRSGRDVYGSYEPEPDSCEAIPRVFPTREFIAFLQRSPGLERLIITDMPLLLSDKLPDVSELHAELPNLRGMHLGGKAQAMGDLWTRLRMPDDTRIFIDADHTETGVGYGGHTFWNLHTDLSMAIKDQVKCRVYDSLRLAMTPSYDLILQMWSSDVYNGTGLELSASLEPSESTLGPAFTCRIPLGTRELLEQFTDQEETVRSRDPYNWIEDPFLRFQNVMATYFYREMTRLLIYVSSSTLRHIDLADMPFIKTIRHIGGYGVGVGHTEKPDRLLLRYLLSSPERSDPPRRNVVLTGEMIYRLLKSDGDRLHDYLPKSVTELTVVDFPCASFPHSLRYDEDYNAGAWGVLLEVLKWYFNQWQTCLSLKLAESTSEMSNMERSEEPEYVHTIPESYEDAVRAVTGKGYQRIAPFVTSFEDLRVHHT